MKIQTLLINLFFFLLITPLQAAILKGSIDNFPKDSLSIVVISNPITLQVQELAVVEVDENGRFQFDFEVPQTQAYYIPLGARQAHVVLSPNQSLEVKLPEYKALSLAQRLNPFFEKETVLVYDENTLDVNYYLTEIEIRQTLWLKSVLSSSAPEAQALKIQDSIALYRESIPFEYAQNYLDIKTLFFWQMASPAQQTIIKERMLRHRAPLLYHPSYIALLNKEFPQAFVADDGLFLAIVSQAIVSGELPKDFIGRIAKTHQISHPKTAALLCILGFYEAARMAPEYEQQILPLMKQLAAAIADPTLKELCLSTQQKMATLCIGLPAPYYELHTPKGKRVPTVLKRKYVLLAFINTNIFTCQRHLRLLEKFKAEFKRDLEVVIIASYQEGYDIERFLQHNTYDKLFFTLWEGNELLMEDYEVDGLPSYYLIAPNGELLYAPLSSPEEHMLEQLNSVIYNAE